MRYYSARQTVKDGKYHYTCGSSPVGHCANDCPGHETAEQAQDHFKEYVLDDMIYKDDSEEPRQLNRCQFAGCKTLTDGRASNHQYYKYYTLCKEHRNRESVATLMHIGEMWIS